MARPRLNLTGMTFGRLTVIESAGVNHGSLWSCRCSCGQVLIADGSKLKNGRTVSCGCWRRTRSDKGTGISGTPEYRAWIDIIQRCTNADHSDWTDYGGRGIRVCDRWLHDFEAFLADMGGRPGAGYSIDRIENNGNYEPGNCRWATKTEQNRNRRNTRLTIAQAESALARHQSGESPGVIAKDLGVSANLVSATAYQAKKRRAG